MLWPSAVWRAVRLMVQSEMGCESGSRVFNAEGGGSHGAPPKLWGAGVREMGSIDRTIDQLLWTLAPNTKCQIHGKC